MDEDTRHTWNNELWVIDRLVDAVEAGDTDAKAKLGQRLMNGIGNDNWDAWTYIDFGPFLPLTFLDPANAEDDDLERLCEDGTLPEARIEDVLNGGRLIGPDLTRWRELVVERAFSSGEFDRDMLWFVIEIRASVGRVGYVASFGYDDGSDRLTNMSFVAAYATYTETMNALKLVGFTGPKDFQARSAEVLAGM